MTSISDSIVELQGLRPLNIYNQRFLDPATHIQIIAGDQYVPVYGRLKYVANHLQKHGEPEVITAYDNVTPYTHLIRFDGEHPGNEFYLARVIGPDDRSEVKRIRFFMDFRNAAHEKIMSEFGYREKVYDEPMRFAALDAMNRAAAVGRINRWNDLVPVDISVYLDELTDDGRALAEAIETTINDGPGSVLMRSTITNHERRMRLAQDTPQRIEELRVMLDEDNQYDVRRFHWNAFRDGSSPEAYLNAAAAQTLGDHYTVEVR